MGTSFFRQLLERAEAPFRVGGAPDQGENGAGAPQLAIADNVYLYLVADDTLAHGSSLGNGRAWLTSKGTGAIEQLFSTDLGRTVTGAFQLHYFARFRDLSPFGWPRTTLIPPREPDSLIYLIPTGTGRYVLHPGYQQHHFTLLGQLDVLETFFLPRLGGEQSDPCAVYFCSEVRNGGDAPVMLTMSAMLDPQGDTPADLTGTAIADGDLLLRNAGEPGWVRRLHSTPRPHHFCISTDIDMVADPGHPFDNNIAAQGRVYAGVQHTRELQPGESCWVTYLVAFHPEGAAALQAQLAALPGAEEALRGTLHEYQRRLFSADVLTPDTLINQGTQWCKANMLRVLADYPTGRAFTNEPGHSSHVVARDVAWYVYGSDLFYPHACCDMLARLAALQQENGKIIEYYHARTGAGEDYGLNINDNTPLFTLAVAHHLRATGHQRCRERLLAPMCRAADYLLSQRDPRGLVFCTAEETGEHGICGWRNVMSGEQISGAVTEVNSECYAALLATADTIDKDNPAAAAHYRQQAAALRAAINTHLVNPRTGIYYLNIGPDGVPRTDITADLVFPQMFGVADDATAQLISTRLNSPDMMTSGGMRTVSTFSPHYHPDRMAGLVGGVWPGVTWWYAMGAAQADPEIMIQALRMSYRQYLRNPRVYNTVPGQFSEWFDGESLVNRGMRLSPWEPPRFLWSVLEGAFGISVCGDTLSMAPRFPAHWRWAGVRNFPYRGRAYSWFYAMVQGERICFTAMPLETTAQLARYAEDVSGQVRAFSEHAGVLAFRREDETLIAVGSESDAKVPVPLQLDASLIVADQQYALAVYGSETGSWDELGIRMGSLLRDVSTWIEARGFVLLRLRPA